MKYEKVVIIVISICLFISMLYGGFVQARLGTVRAELNTVRAELEYAENREQQIRDTIGRANKILEQSSTTIQGIRKQIQEIKHNYEYMESIINSSTDSNSRSDIICQ